MYDRYKPVTLGYPRYEMTARSYSAPSYMSVHRTQFRVDECNITVQLQLGRRKNDLEAEFDLRV